MPRCPCTWVYTVVGIYHGILKFKIYYINPETTAINGTSINFSVRCPFRMLGIMALYNFLSLFALSISFWSLPLLITSQDQVVCLLPPTPLLHATSPVSVQKKFSSECLQFSLRHVAYSVELHLFPYWRLSCIHCHTLVSHDTSDFLNFWHAIHLALKLFTLGS